MRVGLVGWVVGVVLGSNWVLCVEMLRLLTHTSSHAGSACAGISAASSAANARTAAASGWGGLSGWGGSDPPSARWLDPTLLTMFDPPSVPQPRASAVSGVSRTSESSKADSEGGWGVGGGGGGGGGEEGGQGGGLLVVSW